MNLKALYFSLAILFLSLVSGCIQVESKIIVNKDGSGTMEESILLRKSLVDEMRAFVMSFAASMAKESGQEVPEMKPEDFKLLDDDQIEGLKAGVSAMGEGVEFVRAEEIANDKFEGYKAYYKFKDINKLLFNQNPGAKVPKSGGEDEDDESEPEIIRFKFAKGDVSTLTVIMPESRLLEPKGGDSEKKADSEPPDSGKPAEKTPEEIQLEEMMKELLKDMRVSAVMNINGKIAETNAMFRDGEKIILMEMDFNALLANQAAFESFSEENDGTIESAKALMQKIPGMKIDLNREITVKFK